MTFAADAALSHEWTSCRREGWGPAALHESSATVVQPPEPDPPWGWRDVIATSQDANARLRENRPLRAPFSHWRNANVSACHLVLLRASSRRVYASNDSVRSVWCIVELYFPCLNIDSGAIFNCGFAILWVCCRSLSAACFHGDWAAVRNAYESHRCEHSQGPNPSQEAATQSVGPPRVTSTHMWCMPQVKPR